MGDIGAEKYPPCEEARRVCLAERPPTNARAQRQKSVGSVVSKEESRLWKRWVRDLGQILQGLESWAFIPSSVKDVMHELPFLPKMYILS